MSSPNNLGATIEELVITNMRIWHEVTKIKNLSGTLHDKPKMSLEERVNCALVIREHNAYRSKVRWNVNVLLNSGANETKIFSEE